MLSTGTKAPDFTLFATPDQKISLKEFVGEKSLSFAFFYPADWSPGVRRSGRSLYNETLSFFHKHNADLIGISCDGK
jgi:peroxiredoxin